ncbi:MAG: RagB/SusD family nutrient uptake outer membrane protein [Tannerella sp.]|jgi:hypothetical protein|nr:RagB/SusD family nutrient uptake outer membrane protein [Tannerella sp.]
MISKLKTIAILLLAFVASGCSEFLDIVPDSQLTLEMIYYMREDAWNGLAKCYSFLPNDGTTSSSTWLLGDEFMSCVQENKDAWWNGMTVMRGKQSTSDVKIGYWQGSGGATDMYQAIRSCNIFLDKINLTSDLTPKDKADWVAQVKFLKAYYHFVLMRSYGPIIISDVEVSANAVGDNIYQYRSKVDDCFSYIINLMDEAIPDLKETTATTELGQVNQVAAKAIKARVLVYRASPFYSGNRDYFEDFLDVDGKPYFPVFDTEADTKAKWTAALAAVNEAISAATTAGSKLYEYTKPPLIEDRNAMDTNEVRMKTLYSLRYQVVDPWNQELLWGYSNSAGDLPNYTNIMLPDRFEPGSDMVLNQSYSDQELGATYHMLEAYYTKNGLPITEDKTFSYSTRLNIITTPDAEDPEYVVYAGIMQPGVTTISLYMNREMRFYAHLGITGGYFRSHEHRIETDFLADFPNYDISGGGFYSGHADNYLSTGIGVQKLVHPESKSGHSFRLVRYPYPIVRLAELYLLQAEALNESSDAPTQAVYDALNIVRSRAGIPDVETVWSDATLARTTGKHLTKAGMRAIIKDERSLELAFEGHRFWDLVRWKDAVAALSQPVIGWSPLRTSHEGFFVQEIKQTRKFSFRDCLWPITLSELNKNSNLIQNPGW